ncbi:MAG: hypothetical protein FWG16_01045, partial [Micrococcales bacterium]|nr:hypothetical protein [Micrococcales bacterium]
MLKKRRAPIVAAVAVVSFLLADGLAVASSGSLSPISDLTWMRPAAPVTEAAEAETFERVDALSAGVAARALGAPVEDLSSRTEVSRLFAQPDGSWQMEMNNEPVRALDDDGVWRDLDDTLVKASDGLVEPKVSTDHVKLSAGGVLQRGAVSQVLASLEGEDSTGQPVSLVLGWEGSLPAPQLKGNTAVYAGVAEVGATKTVDEAKAAGEVKKTQPVVVGDVEVRVAHGVV